MTTNAKSTDRIVECRIRILRSFKDFKFFIVYRLLICAFSVVSNLSNSSVFYQFLIMLLCNLIPNQNSFLFPVLKTKENKNFEIRKWYLKTAHVLYFLHSLIFFCFKKISTMYHLKKLLKLLILIQLFKFFRNQGYVPEY